MNMSNEVDATTFPAPTTERMTGFAVIDFASRVFPAAFFAIAVKGKVSEVLSLIFSQELYGGHQSLFALIIEVSSMLSIIAFLSLITVLFLVRSSPIKKAKGIMPRVMAITGTFFMALITMFPKAELSLAQSAVATIIVLLGTSASIYAAYNLGRSFSLMAEARRLVTTGPYAFVRHPLYLAELTASFGVLLQFFSIYTLLLFAVLIFIQISRMKNEEAVLEATFPEYGGYKAKTARLIPKFY